MAKLRLTTKPHSLSARLEFWLARVSLSSRRRRSRRGWDLKWSREDFARPWLSRGVSREVRAAVEEGWFAPGAAAIDLGCGEGEIAAWLAEHGFPSLGVDIAPAAIQRARARFGTLSPRLAFLAHDICAGPPAGGPYGVLVDRGCFHQIAPEDRSDYARSLRQIAGEDASLLLFHKAYRNGLLLGDPKERRRVTDIVEGGLGAGFEIRNCAETYLDPFHGADSKRALPGLVFWMKRR